MPNRVKVAQAAIQRVLQERGVYQQDTKKVVEQAHSTAPPESFEFRGIRVNLPFGASHEVVKGTTLDRLNRALVANNNQPIRDKIPTVELCMRAYLALWAKTKQPDYDPTPVPTVEHVTPKRRTMHKVLDDLEAQLRELSC